VIRSLFRNKLGQVCRTYGKRA